MTDQPDIKALADSLRPAAREQMGIMRDGPLRWSRDSGWPGIRDDLEIKKLIRPLDRVDQDRVTEITDLGRAVRDHLRAEQAA